MPFKRKLPLFLLVLLSFLLPSVVPGRSGASDGGEFFRKALQAFVTGQEDRAAGYLLRALEQRPDHLPSIQLAARLGIRPAAPVPGPARPEAVEPGTGTIFLDLREADLREVLRLLAREHDLNIAAGPQVRGTVSARLSGVPVREALRVILDSNGYDYEETGGVILVDAASAIRSRREMSAAEQSRDFENRLALARQLLETEREKERWEVEFQTLVTRVYHLENVSADDIEEAVRSVLSSRGEASVVARTVAGGWEMGGGSSELGRKSRLTTDREELPSVLVVTDVPARHEMVAELLAVLDREVPQVMIDAMIVEVDSGAMRELGVEWSGRRGDFNHGFFPGIEQALLNPGEESGLTSIYDYANPLRNRAVYARIRALETENRARVLSNPRVMAAHNQEAVIMVGERYPIITTRVQDSLTGPITTGTLDRYEPIGISLRVIPRVTKNGFINLAVHPEVTDLGVEVTGGGLSLPRIKTREADTLVTVADGEMVAIGGLIKDQESTITRKVPFLGSIPLLGALFRSEEKMTGQVELLILLTPRVVSQDGPETARP